MQLFQPSYLTTSGRRNLPNQEFPSRGGEHYSLQSASSDTHNERTLQGNIRKLFGMQICVQSIEFD